MISLFYSSEVRARYNHAFSTVALRMPTPGFTPGLQAPSFPQFRCPCGQIIYTQEKFHEDEGVHVCPKCGDWHFISWRHAA